MKKFLKGCLILVAALAAAGAILVCVAIGGDTSGKSMDALNRTEWMQSHGWRITQRGPLCWKVTRTSGNAAAYGNSEAGEASAQQKYVYNSSEVKEIRLSAGADHVQIRPSQDDQIRVEVLDDTYYTVNVSDSTLTIQSDTSDFQFGFGITSDDTPQAILYLPKSYTPDRMELKVESGELESEMNLQAAVVVLGVGSGEIKLSQDITATQELLADTGSGELEVEHMICNGRFRTAVGSGDVSITGSVFGDVKADAGSGDIELDLIGIYDQDAYEIACGSGEVTVNGRSYDSAVTIPQTGGDSTIWLNCGSGSIKMTCDRAGGGQHHSENHDAQETHHSF